MAASILERAGRRIGPAGTADAARGRRLLDWRWLLAMVALGLVVVAWLAVAYGGSWGSVPDTEAYWLAGLRLREGAELYPAWANENAVEVYRYAPWFAALWAPLTLLPKEMVYAAWNLLCVGGAIAAVVPLLRQGTRASVALAVLMGAFLVPSAGLGTLIIGGLTIALPRRSSPVWVGIAGSLKVYPLVFVAGYAAERRWRAVAVSLGTAALLWAPALWFGIEHYPGAGNGGVSLFGVSPLLWALVAVPVVLATLALAWLGSRWTWLAAAASIGACLPRAWLGEAGYVLVAVPMLAKADVVEERLDLL